MPKTPRRILVTSALPYANGPIHLGHLVEYIQTDIWVRFWRLQGHTCLYVCADDAHGTPIMLKAQAEGITPEALIEAIGAAHQADFADFFISFDQYYTTHSEENRRLAERIYTRLRDRGHIVRRPILQAFDEAAGLFLPDRYLKGTCPRCGAPDQYGDACEVCGATYTPADLINPVSAITGTPPVMRESEHYFFKLANFEPLLRTWTGAGTLQPEIQHKLEEWFSVGLRDWDISRDAPYFGFEIPDAPGKYFYVWLDAPIGYIASFKHWCDRTGCDFDDFWAKDAGAELYHFIGKDIAYFHTLFWPAMLKGAGLRTPTAVYCHGFLTVNGQKMSKSRGTFITARRYLEHLDPEYLRYYYAAKLGPGVEDIDLSLEDFTARVNSDLVGKLVNIASRCAGFITRHFDGQLARALAEPALYEAFTQAGASIGHAYAGREYARAMREVMSLADQANQYIDAHKPWALAKAADRLPEVQAICTMGLNLFKVLMTYLKPVLPRLAERAEAFLQSGALDWTRLDTPLLERAIAPFTPLMTRIDKTAVHALIEASKEDLTPVSPSLSATPASFSTPASPVTPELITPAPPRPDTEPVGDPISLEDFTRLDLRVARIVKAEPVEGADKLLKLTLDLGDHTRTVFAGIKAAYDPATLAGRLTVVLANLTPRKMRFGVSEGMVLAAGPGGQDVFLLAPDAGAKPGMRIK